MKKVKAPDFTAINEAKEWKVGEIVKAKYNHRLGQYTDRHGWKWEWKTLDPYRLDINQDDIFYFVAQVCRDLVVNF